MVITAIRLVPPHNVRTEVVAEVVLSERNGPVSTLAVERYPVKFDQEEFELTAHFAPHNSALSLAIVQQKETIAHFLVCCTIPCELTFRLPSAEMLRLFCDPKQLAPRDAKKA
jgi:hypothetical protein